MRKGSYDSNVTAIEGLPFPLVPQSLKKALPQGIVLYFETNKSISQPSKGIKTDSWIIESKGSIRSERLFVLAELTQHEKPVFFRASELYVTTESSVDKSMLAKELPEANFRVLGQNEKTSEFIVQLKEFSPAKLRNYLDNMPAQYSIIKEVRLYPMPEFE